MIATSVNGAVKKSGASSTPASPMIKPLIEISDRTSFSTPSSPIATRLGEARDVTSLGSPGTSNPLSQPELLQDSNFGSMNNSLTLDPAAIIGRTEQSEEPLAAKPGTEGSAYAKLVVEEKFSGATSDSLLNIEADKQAALQPSPTSTPNSVFGGSSTTSNNAATPIAQSEPTAAAKIQGNVTDPLPRNDAPAKATPSPQKTWSSSFKQFLKNVGWALVRPFYWPGFIYGKFVGLFSRSTRKSS